MNSHHQTLRVDITGLPLEWVDYKEAVKLYAVNQVIYTLGNDLYTIYGGINAASGKQSSITVNSIIATNGRTCLLYTSPSPRDKRQSRMPSSA